MGQPWADTDMSQPWADTDMSQPSADTDMGQPWADTYKSAATTGRAEVFSFFEKYHFWDFPSLRRLPGLLKAVFLFSGK